MSIFSKLVAVLLIGLSAACAAVPVRSAVGTINRVVVQDTGSMWPVVDHTFTAEVVPVPYAKLRVGYVVIRRNCWWNPCGIVAHRIATFEYGHLPVTKGDANNRYDPGYLDEEDYLGCIELDARSRIRFADEKEASR